MGDHNKLLLPFNGKTLIEGAVDTLVAAGVDEVIVVVGYQAHLIKGVLASRDILIVDNPDYRQGMASSIRAGVAAVSTAADAIMICLADQPLLEPRDLNRIMIAMHEARAAGKSIVVPFYQGRRGNPVMLDAAHKNKMIDTVGDIGCRRIIKQNPDSVYIVEMETDHVVRDVDSTDDYECLLRNAMPQ